MSLIQLFDGDATFTKSFAKVGFTDSGSKTTATFRSEKGKQFVVLLLGEVDAKATDCDLEEMLRKLGYQRIPE